MRTTEENDWPQSLRLPCKVAVVLEQVVGKLGLVLF